MTLQDATFYQLISLLVGAVTLIIAYMLGRSSKKTKEISVKDLFMSETLVNEAAIREIAEKANLMLQDDTVSHQEFGQALAEVRQFWRIVADRVDRSST